MGHYVGALDPGRQSVPSTSGLITTIAYTLATGTAYALEGSVAETGSAVQATRSARSHPNR